MNWGHVLWSEARYAVGIGDVNLPDCRGCSPVIGRITLSRQFPAYQLTCDVDVVALFEVPRRLGTPAEEDQRQKLAMRNGLALSVVLPALRQPCPHEFAISDPVDRGLVGEIP